MSLTRTPVAGISTLLKAAVESEALTTAHTGRGSTTKAKLPSLEEMSHAAFCEVSQTPQCMSETPSASDGTAVGLELAENHAHNICPLKRRTIDHCTADRGWAAMMNILLYVLDYLTTSRGRPL